jgi:hypothetical protein
MNDEAKLKVKVKAILRKRDPDTKELLSEEEKTFEVTGDDAKELMRKKGVNI